MISALLPLAKGFEDIEAVSIVDVLRRGGVRVVTASLGPSVEVESAHGVTLRADALLPEVLDAPYDIIVLPGGGEGTENLKKCEPLLARLARQREDGRLLAAICAAPTVLSAAGLLSEDQHATCYPTCQMEMDCPWIDQSVVVHEGIITGQAPGCSILFALVILQTLVGEVAARRIARGMIVEF